MNFRCERGKKLLLLSQIFIHYHEVFISNILGLKFGCDVPFGRKEVVASGWVLDEKFINAGFLHRMEGVLQDEKCFMFWV